MLHWMIIKLHVINAPTSLTTPQARQWISELLFCVGLQGTHTQTADVALHEKIYREHYSAGQKPQVTRVLSWHVITIFVIIFTLGLTVKTHFLTKTAKRMLTEDDPRAAAFVQAPTEELRDRVANTDSYLVQLQSLGLIHENCHNTTGNRTTHLLGIWTMTVTNERPTHTKSFSQFSWI